MNIIFEIYNLSFLTRLLKQQQAFKDLARDKVCWRMNIVVRGAPLPDAEGMTLSEDSDIYIEIFETDCLL